MSQRARLARRVTGGRLLAALGVVAVLAGCGGGDDGYYCNPREHPAVLVRLVDAFDGRPVVTPAVGSAYDGYATEDMLSPDPNYSRDGMTSVLAAGFGRTGIYDVVVRTGSGEQFNWSGIRVSGDECGPFTVELEAPVRRP